MVTRSSKHLHRTMFLCAAIVGLACADPPTDPHTVEGAHYLFVRSLATRDYPAVYALLTPSCRHAFQDYLRNTRDVIALIQSRYPVALRAAAQADLSIPFAGATFTVGDIERAGTDDSVFTILCQKMFSDTSQVPSFVQEFGTRPGRVDYPSPDSAVVTTLAGEKLTYLRGPDGIWRTREIFGQNFDNLVRVSRSNLEITENNAELYAR